MADATIKQRIALEGVQEIMKQLRDLGATGEQAFKQIQAAVEKQQLKKPAEELKNVGEAIKGVAEKLRELGGAGGQIEGPFGMLLGLAGRLNPLTAALGAITGAMLALGKSSATQVLHTDQMAKGLGLARDQYLSLKKAAGEYGVDDEKFDAGFTRFARKVDTEGRQQQSSVVDVTKGLFDTFKSGELPSVPIPNYMKLRDQLLPVLGPIRASLAQLSEELNKAGVPGDSALAKSLSRLSDPALADRVVRLAAGSDKFREALTKMGAAPLPTDAVQGFDALTKKLEPSFAAMGVQLVDTDGKLKSNYQVFKEWGEKVGEIKDPAEQARKVIEIFPKQVGPQMVKFITEGTHSVDEWKHKLSDLHLIPTDEEVKKAHELQKAWDELGTHVAAAKMQLGRTAQSLGAQGFIGNFTHGLEQIENGFQDYRHAPEVFKQKASDLWEGTKQTGSDLWEGTKQAASAAWADIKQTVAAAWADIKADFAKLSGLWDGLKEGATQIWNDVKAAFTEAVDSLKEKLSPLVSVWDTVKSAAQSAWDGIKSYALAAIEAIKAAARSLNSFAGKSPGAPQTGAGASAPDASAAFSAGATGGLIEHGAVRRFFAGGQIKDAPGIAPSLPGVGAATGGFLRNETVKRFFSGSVVKTLGFLSGGLIKGKGTGTSDSILARFDNGGMIRVSNGEFIVRERAVKHVGLGFLNAINKAPGYADGGPIGNLRHSLDGFTKVKTEGMSGFTIGGALSVPSFASGGMANDDHHNWGTIDLRTDHGVIQAKVKHDTMRDLQSRAVQAKVARGGRRQTWNQG